MACLAKQRFNPHAYCRGPHPDCPGCRNVGATMSSHAHEPADVPSPSSSSEFPGSTLSDVLKNMDLAGLRKTRLRAEVARVVVESGSPLSAHEVHERLANLKPNLVTIYRVLHLLVRLGLLAKVGQPGTAMKFASLPAETRSVPMEFQFECLVCGHRTVPDRAIASAIRLQLLTTVGKVASLYVRGECRLCTARQMADPPRS